MTKLRYEVVVSDGVPRNRAQRLPDGGPIVSSPVASTLILGQRDAVLVDPPFTRDQIKGVGDWVERSGKRLSHIYATHGHGDHWFGTDVLMRRSRRHRVCHRGHDPTDAQAGNGGPGAVVG
jgi:glyoxylase-like metal-dependent hydrolase (beta-lactamase superfamily II)